MPKTTSTANKWRLLLALTLGALALWLSTPDASAHAAYVSSSPVFGEVLSEPPMEISITFSQELFRREGANAVTLRYFPYYPHDIVASYGFPSPVISNDDRHTMRVAVSEELLPGRYLVLWTNLSAEDGDVDTGVFPFYVSRLPTEAEIEWNRQLAAELLITYPWDEVEQSESEVASPTAPPIVVRAESPSDASLGVGPVIWFVVGFVAALALLATLILHRINRRQVE